MKRIVLVIFSVFAVAQAFGVQVKYSIAYYHDRGNHPANDYNVSQLPFTPLAKLYDLPPLDNDGAYLFKITLRQPVPPSGIVVYTQNEYLDTMAFYRQQTGKLILAGYTGNNFRSNGQQFGPPVFELHGADTTFFLKIAFKKNVILPLLIYTVPEYGRANTSLFFQVGLYHGLVIAVFFINLFLFIVFKDKRFLYYSLFLLFLVLSFLYSNSHIRFLSQNPFFLNNGDFLLHIGLAITGALFATSFLEIDKVYPWAKWVTAALVGIVLVMFALNTWRSNFFVFMTGELAAFGSLAMYWVISLYRVKKHAFSKYFAMAYGVLLFFTFNYYFLRRFGIYWFDLFTGQMEVGNLVEMIILSVALTFSVEKLRQQNQRFRLEIERYMQNEISLQTQAMQKVSDVFAAVQLKYNLTERETEVLKCIRDGMTNAGIADKLFLSVNTIKFHTRNVFEKMEISNRAQAVSKLHEAR